MGLTMKIAADRDYDDDVSVWPAETARGQYIENPPSAAALKLLHFLIAKTGPRMIEDRQHRFRMTELRKVDGMQRHTRATLREAFTELSAAILVFDDKEAEVELIGSLIDGARLDYRDEASGDLLVTWRFGSTFRELAERSEMWALIDLQAVFSMSSRYAIALYTHIASLAGLRFMTKTRFTVEELRGVLGVPRGHHARFAEFKRHALAVAVAEINAKTRHRLEARLIKAGRHVIAVEIAWSNAS